MSDHIFIGIAWPYANGRLHLGHAVGALLPADIFARFHRLRGNRILAVTGSDAHGTPITIAADKAGIAPRELFERNHRDFLETQCALGISYDLFTHTDTENHHRVAQDVFRKLHDRGYIHPRKQNLYFDEKTGLFLADRYVEGTCPRCNREGARGDQCDACGQLLDPLELVNPVNIRDGSTPAVRESEQLYFDLGAFSNALLALYDAHAHHWRSHVLNFSRRLVEDGLRERPFTRDLEWGVSVPVPGWEEKKLYIWAENIVGYLSASIEWAYNRGTPDAWRLWWTNPAARSYYFLGKDNVPFHTVFWPAELLGIQNLYTNNPEERLNLPYDVPANAHLTLGGQQFSKSRNHAVWLGDALARYDADALRYALTAILPETQDTTFSWDDFVRRNDNELVATWGNLVHRVLSFAFKHWDGCVPKPKALRPFDQTLHRDIEAGFDRVTVLYDAVRLRPALHETVRLARLVNGYLDKAPWYGVIGEDKCAAATTVYTALWAIDTIKTLLAPVLPFSCEQLHTLLGYDEPLFGSVQIETFHESTRSHDALTYDPRAASGRWQISQLPPGQRILHPTPLFTKLA